MRGLVPQYWAKRWKNREEASSALTDLGSNNHSQAFMGQPSFFLVCSVKDSFHVEEDKVLIHRLKPCVP